MEIPRDTMSVVTTVPKTQGFIVKTAGITVLQVAGLANGTALIKRSQTPRPKLGNFVAARESASSAYPRVEPGGDSTPV